MFRVFTDSGSNLPAELLKKYQIGLVPLRYTMDGEDFVCFDRATGAFEGHTYYERMRQGADVKTSMVSVGAFADAFRPVLAAGEDVLYVGMSSGISGTYTAACLAAEELRPEFPGRRIVTVDTHCASLAEGIPALRAAELRAEGASFEKAAETAQAMSDTMCQYFTVADLRYLQKGGRISALSAKIGSVLGIKPILWGNELGQIICINKVRGERKAYDALADAYDRLCADRTARIGIAHADNPEGLEALVSRLRAKGLTGEILSVCYEPVTGSHVGPGAVALFFNGIHRHGLPR